MNDAWLAHHGVLGMKWGVRRFQNADGSLTKRGLEHYKKSEAKYDAAKEKYTSAKNAYKQSKSDTDKEAMKASKKELKEAKKKMSHNYDELKKDHAADIGKEMYRNGKTITGNANFLSATTLIASGTAAAHNILKQKGNEKMAKYALYAGAGLEAVNAVLAAKNHVEAHYLRAYYGHSSKYED